MHLPRPQMFLIVLMAFLCAASLAFGQQEPANQEADGRTPEAEAEAEPQAEADENGNGNENGYTGTWSLVIGPSRLLWELEAEEYEFYAYQSGTVRIGSRGELSAEENELTFLAQETTTDGESWREVEVSEEQATATFAYSVEDEVLSLAVPGRPQFATEYEAGEGEPLESQKDENGAGEEAGDQLGPNDQTGDEAEPGALDIQ